MTRKTALLSLALVMAAVTLFAALPFSQFGWSNAEAQYGASAEASCGGTVLYQIRLYGDTQTYLDSALTVKGPVVSTASKARQKYLICTPAVGATVVKMFYITNIVYVPATAGDIVVRSAKD